MKNNKRRRTGESTWLGPALSAGFGAGATALGYGAFAPAASAFGGWLGQKFKDITGYGDYEVRKNSLLSGTVPTLGNPSSHPDGLTISHREYLGDVITSPTAGAFAIRDYTLNPSLSATWEWLSQIAGNYEEWVPEGIIFYFKSTSGENVANAGNTSLGTVIMATNYNPYNRAFSTKAEMESYEFCSNGAPSCDLMHAIECDPHDGAISTYFMNTFMIDTTKSASMDARFGQLGTFYIATVGIPAASVNIGELWVTYQITLLKPKLYNSLGFDTDNIAFGCPTVATTATAASGLWQLHGGSASFLTMPFTGYTASTSLYVTPGANLVDIHWPVYAYGTTYSIEAYVTMDSIAVPTWTIAHNNMDAPAACVPSTVGVGVAVPTPGVTDTKTMVSFTVYVPGGYIPSTTNTPRSRISLTGPLTNANIQWNLQQIPNMNGLSAITYA